MMASIVGVYAQDWPEKTGGAKARRMAADEIRCMAERVSSITTAAYGMRLASYIRTWQETNRPIPACTIDAGEEAGRIEALKGRAVARCEAAGAPPEAVSKVEEFADAVLRGEFSDVGKMMEAAERAANEIEGD